MSPWIALFLGACALAFACQEGLSDLWRRWTLSEGYYGHGPLVVLTCAGWIYARRRELPRPPWGSSWVGPGLLLLSLPLLAIGLLERVMLAQNLACYLGGLGLAASLVDRRGLTRLGAPLLFLLFAIPLPTPLLDALTFKLKLFAAKAAAASLAALGEPVLLDGGVLHLSDQSLLVADACSGLKMVISLLALGALLGCLQRTWARGLSVFALSLPLAVLANVTRVLALSAAALYDMPAVLEPGPLHSALGLVIYAGALGALLVVHKLLIASGPEATPRPTLEPGPGLRPAPIAVAGLLLLTLCGLRLGATQLTPPPRQGLPLEQVLPLKLPGYRGERVPLSDEVRRVLGTNDVAFTTYRSAPGLPPVDVYVTRSSSDIFRVAHPPERCFTGAGFQEAERGPAELSLAGRAVEVNRVLFEHDEGAVLVYYWYLAGGEHVQDYLHYRLTSFLQRLRRHETQGSMLRLSTPLRPGEPLARAERRLRGFARRGLPPICDLLEDDHEPRAP